MASHGNHHSSIVAPRVRTMCILSHSKTRRHAMTKSDAQCLAILAHKLRISHVTGAKLMADNSKLFWKFQNILSRMYALDTKPQSHFYDYTTIIGTSQCGSLQATCVVQLFYFGKFLYSYVLTDYHTFQ